MNVYLNDDRFQEQALAYLKGEMGADERALFEKLLIESEDARTALEKTRSLLDVLSAASDESVVGAVDSLLARVLESGASDLHLQPERKELVILARRDGALREIERRPHTLGSPIIDRLKVMARMDLSERRLPQDGRIPIKHQEKEYDLRVTTLPTLYGERITIRILSRATEDNRLGLDNLGLAPARVAALRRLVRRPSGLVVVTGNIGTGKTTLLYSLLQEIQASDQPRRSLFTVEDPIEYALPGVAQVGVHKRSGYTYENALQALFRSDADVVLCAQMRSLAIAELLVELAHTGRLALTALHVSSALSVIDWMHSVGVEPFLTAETLAGVVSLRLVGKVCEHCREEYAPAPDEVRRAGLSPVEDGPFSRGRGCDVCGGTGIWGRVPLCEVIEMDTPQRRRIAQRATGDALWADTFGRTGGSLRDDARAKVRAGWITVESANWVLTDYPHAAPGSGASAASATLLPDDGAYSLPPFSEGGQ